jgi:hypothetical protein
MENEAEPIIRIRLMSDYQRQGDVKEQGGK